MGEALAFAFCVEPPPMPERSEGNPALRHSIDDVVQLVRALYFRRAKP